MSEQRTYTNSGKLYRNRNKNQPKHPDYTSFPSAAHITCPHCQNMTPWKMVAWIKNGRIPGTKFMSIAFQIDTPKAPAGMAPAPDAPAPAENPTGESTTTAGPEVLF